MQKLKHFLILTAILILFSCNNSFYKIGENKNIKYGKIYINIDSDKTRTVVPIISDTSIDSYEINFTSNDGYVSQNITSSNNSANITKIEAGSWNISVNAKQSGNIVAAGSLINTIILADQTNNINITLYPTQSAKGNINLRISFPVSSEVDYIEAGLEGDAYASIPLDTSTDTNYKTTVFSKNDITSGIKNLILIFKKGGALGTILGMYRECVNVYDYQTSDKWMTSTGLSGVLLFENDDFASTNTFLSALSVSTGELTPIFSSGIFNYQVELSNTVSSIKIIPTQFTKGQSLKYKINDGVYNDILTGAESVSLSLNIGDNSIDVSVTSQDGETNGLYTIICKRLQLPGIPVFYGGVSGNRYGVDKSLTLSSSNSTKIYYSITSQTGSYPADPTNPTKDTGILFDSYVDLTADAGETKFYKIKAIAYNGQDDAGSVSSVWKAIIDKESPLTPVLNGAISGSTYDIDKRITITSIGADYIYYIVSANIGSEPTDPDDPTTDNGILYQNFIDLTCDAREMKYFKIKAIAFDLVNNVSLLSGMWSITIDKDAQLASLANLPSNPSKDSTTDIIVTGGDVVTYKYKIDSDSYSVETDITNHIALSGLTEGEHTIYVIGKDNAGNWQEETSATRYIWTVDITAPIVTFNPNGVSSPVNEQTTYVSIDETVTLLQYQWTDFSTFPVDGSWTNFTTGDEISIDTVTADYYLHIKAIDIAGNERNATSDKFVIDNTAPDMPTIIGVTNGYYNADVTFDISGAEAGGTIQYSYDGTNWSDYSGMVTITDEGTYNLRAKHIDIAGNISNITSPISFVIDKTPPDTPIISGFVSGGRYANNLSFSLLSNGSDKIYYKITESVGSAPVDPEDPTTDNGILFIDTVNLSCNENETKYFKIKSISFDTAGNPSGVSEIWSVIIDKEAPGIPIISGIETGFYNTDKSFTINGETDSTIDYSYNGTDWLVYSGPVTVSVDGAYDLRTKQRDRVGNESLVSEIISFRIDKSNPTPGSGINFTNIMSTSLTVNCGVATDNLTATENLKYKLVKATTSTAIDAIDEVNAITGADLVMDWTANTLTKNITGLTSNTTYYFAALVMDESGNKGLYSPVGVTTAAPVFNPRWAKSLASADNNSKYFSVKTDSSGNIYCAGYISGAGNFDFGNGVTLYVSAGTWNLVVVKYNSSGLAQWAQTVTNPTSSHLSSYNSVFVDGSGNVYAAGYIVGNVTYNFGNSITATGTYPSYNIVLVKYNSSGLAQWAKTVTTGPNNSQYLSVGVDSSGNVYCAGYISGNSAYNFGNSITATSPFSATYTLLLVKYDSLGTTQWAKTITSGSDMSKYNSLVIDTAGNIYATGFICGTGSYNFGNGITVAGNSVQYNVVLVKYNSSGLAQWAKSTVTAYNSSIYWGISLDSSSNIYCSGFITNALPYDFGNSVSATGAVSGYNALLVKYNSSGTPQWAKSLTTAPNYSEYYGVTTDSLGNIYTVGYINGNSSYNFGSSVTATGTCMGGNNLIIVKYNSAGTPLIAKSIASAGGNESLYNSVCSDSNGNIYAVGYISGVNVIYNLGNSISISGPFGNNALLVKYSEE